MQGNGKVCRVEGCDKPAYSRAMCRSHYDRTMRHRWRKARYKGRCPTCGVEFTSAHPEQVYCSKRCGFESPVRGAYLRSMTEAAQARAHAKAAVKAERKVLARWAKAARRRQQKAERSLRPTLHRQCRECDSHFETTLATQVYCAPECSKRSHKRVQRHKRRALERAAKIESVNPTLVFERDGWRCQLCGVRTPARLRGTYDGKAPELDHIVPLAAGGDHGYANTQCACRKCNQEKADTPIGQLWLLGGFCGDRGPTPSPQGR